MKVHRRLMLSVAVSLLATTFGCGGGPEGSEGEAKRILFLMNGNSPFWDTMREGIKAASDEFGIEAHLETNDGTPAGQIEKLRQFGTQVDIAGVAVCAIDAANVAIADELRKLRESGVKVITVDSDIDRGKFRDARFAFVGTDNYAGGVALGICAKELREDGGKYVTFVGRKGAQNAIERIGGFGEGAGEAFTSLDSMQDENNRTRAKENVRNAIRNHEELDTLVGIWSYNAPAIVDVVDELGVRDRMTVVTFDAEPIAIKQLGEGKIDAMVVQNPFEMGYQGVRLLKALIDDDQGVVAELFPRMGEEDGDLYDTGLKVVVPDSGSPISSDDFQGNTQFMLLDAFQEWLDEYGLEGS